jgi:hypothetical protein
MEFTRKALIAEGFQGFLKASELTATKMQEVPTSGGVYVVLRETAENPRFPEVSKGGWFKGKNPAVSKTELESNWVPGAPVIYIGKGDNLRRRLGSFLRFGRSEPAAHWGGRYIWQLEGSAEYIFAWKLAEPGQTASQAEAELLRDFKSSYHGRRPFANLVG